MVTCVATMEIPRRARRRKQTSLAMAIASLEGETKRGWKELWGLI